MEGLLRVGDDRGGGLVNVVEARLGIFVDLDDVANGGMALSKIVEALRGTFFFSTSVELKAKGAGGAGRETIDSNTSLPSILASKHF